MRRVTAGRRDDHRPVTERAYRRDAGHAYRFDADDENAYRFDDGRV